MGYGPCQIFPWGEIEKWSRVHPVQATGEFFLTSELLGIMRSGTEITEWGVAGEDRQRHSCYKGGSIQARGGVWLINGA